MSIHRAITNKKTTDGFENVFRGLGQGRDITSNARFKTNRLISTVWQELDDLYTSNWIASKAIDIPVDDALKDDRIFQSEESEKLEAFKNALEDFDIDNKIAQALKWSRVFGSAFLILVTDDDTMDRPLNIKRVKNLSNIAVLDRFDVYADALERNPLSPRYLEPEYYMLTKQGAKIHHTRVIKIDGVVTTNNRKEQLGGYGLSLFERIFKTILNADASPTLLINLLEQSNIDVFKILGLNEALSNDEDSLVLKRLQTIMTGKSVFNGVALDAEDGYENITKNFAGLGDINKEFYQIVAGAAEIPFSRFMGAQLSGLNPTGEGELKTYYDKLISIQKRLVKTYNKIDEVLMMHLFGETFEYKWEFENLFKMTPQQIADIENKNAQTKQIYLNMNVISEYEAKAGLIDNPLFPTITAETIEAEEALYNEVNEY